MEECEVEIYCTLKHCKDPENRWMNVSNCTCRECLKNSENKECDLSGESYNTDGDCLAMK